MSPYITILVVNKHLGHPLARNFLLGFVRLALDKKEEFKTEIQGLLGGFCKTFLSLISHHFPLFNA